MRLGISIMCGACVFLSVGPVCAGSPIQGTQKAKVLVAYYTSGRQTIDCTNGTKPFVMKGVDAVSVFYYADMPRQFWYLVEGGDKPGTYMIGINDTCRIDMLQATDTP